MSQNKDILKEELSPNEEMRPDGDTYKNYLRDIGYFVKEDALETKEERDKKKECNQDYSFIAGQLAGFREIIALMQGYAEKHGIPLEDLRLHDIDPDRDLV